MKPEQRSLPKDTPLNPKDLLVTVKVEVYETPDPSRVQMRLSTEGLGRMSPQTCLRILLNAVAQLRETHDLH